MIFQNFFVVFISRKRFIKTICKSYILKVTYTDNHLLTSKIMCIFQICNLHTIYTFGHR